VSVALFAAIAAGLLIAVQSAIIGAFGGTMHPFVAAMYVHLGGLVFGALAILLVPRFGFEVAALKQAQWGLLGGVAGMLLVTGVAVAVGGLGLASTLAMITGVQLLAGFVMESSGVLDRVVALDPIRLGGAALIVVGVFVVVSRGPAAT
jgi:bacterial/archaeal transporter family-2 protein